MQAWSTKQAPDESEQNSLPSLWRHTTQHPTPMEFTTEALAMSPFWTGTAFAATEARAITIVVRSDIVGYLSGVEVMRREIDACEEWARHGAGEGEGNAAPLGRAS